MSVDILIPVCHPWSCTNTCLEGFRAAGGGASGIVVIDNGSSDGTVETLASCPGVTVVRTAENLGCAVAWNQGARASRSFIHHIGSVTQHSLRREKVVKPYEAENRACYREHRRRRLLVPDRLPSVPWGSPVVRSPSGGVQRKGGITVVRKEWPCVPCDRSTCALTGGGGSSAWRSWRPARGTRNRPSC